MGLLRGARHLIRAGAALLAAVVLGVVALPRPAVAASPTLVWDVSITGESIHRASPSRPILLGRTDPTRLVVDLENRGAEPVTVRSVRLEGHVLGLTFFNYSTRMDVTLAPNETTQRQIDLDLDDLTRQAVGLLPADVRLVDANRKTLDEYPFPVQVRGSLLSLYGLFGLAVFVVTVLLLGWLLVLVWRRALPSNRWARAVRFLPVGLGVGFTLTFFLSAVSLLLPSASRWLPLVLVCAAVGFLVGYLMPMGHDDQTADATPAAQKVGQHV